MPYQIKVRLKDFSLKGFELQNKVKRACASDLNYNIRYNFSSTAKANFHCYIFQANIQKKDNKE